MRCLLRRVAPNRFSALCLELDFEVVAGSKVSAFKELIRALCAEAKNDIAVSGVLPFRGSSAALPENAREFKKAKPMVVGFGGDHCWDVRYSDDDAYADSGESVVAQVMHATRKGAAKNKAADNVAAKKKAAKKNLMKRKKASS
jgi:hypothetical protein